MQLLITGSQGFIGRATVNTALNAGHRVVEFDVSTGHDVLDGEVVRAAAECSHAVIHLAGVLGTSELYDTPDLAVDVNIKGTLRVLEACRALNIPFIGITMPSCWTNMYQATRVAAQKIAHGFNRDFGVPVTHIRAFNGYGPYQAVGPGHPQKIVPTFATKSWRGEPMPIWGDGEQLVDLVHVDDIAWRLVAAAEGGPGTGEGQTWDAGCRVMTVNQVAYEVGLVTGNDKVEYLPMRYGELPDTYVQAFEYGPWPPRTTPEEERARLADVVMWYRP